ncbi:hypothetical protein E2C01_027801 [Portunus trituberculatus]|uniref:Uncharacterized protein n=1 Tax=Portunus trituberculatus TaxID=210409 RepID=A0A5B7EPU9_PORTR|nr:hypothetical protein [Portunus trituberculatus]
MAPHVKEICSLFDRCNGTLKLSTTNSAFMVGHLLGVMWGGMFVTAAPLCCLHGGASHWSDVGVGRLSLLLLCAAFMVGHLIGVMWGWDVDKG